MFLHNGQTLLFFFKRILHRKKVDSIKMTKYQNPFIHLLGGLSFALVAIIRLLTDCKFAENCGKFVKINWDHSSKANADIHNLKEEYRCNKSKSKLCKRPYSSAFSCTLPSKMQILISNNKSQQSDTNRHKVIQFES